MTLFNELKTLFWLQWKLTLSMFRSRKADDWARILRIGLQLLQALIAFPVFIGFGIGVAIGLAFLTPRAAFEMVVLINTLLAFFWLLMPSMYSSQVMERFEMSRLFAYPISFRGIVIGSTLVAMGNLTGLWTLPILAGEIVGLAWHAPLMLPLIALGAIPVFALLVLAGRMMDDLFDLVASDRRLRALTLTLLSLPFMLIWIGQYYVQYATDNFERLPAFLENTFIAEELTALEGASFSQALEMLRPSRFLLWLPPGWVTAGMGMPIIGNAGQGLLFLALSVLAVGALLWLHAGVTRRLMAGAALRLGAEKIRARRGRFDWMPGPPAFRALFAKDWTYLRRSPMPRRMVFAAVIITLGMSLSFAGLPGDQLPEQLTDLPFVFGVGLLMFLLMPMNMAMTANYFGAIDREGFGSLVTSVLDWRYVLLAANLAMACFSLLSIGLVTFVVTYTSKNWLMLPLTLYVGLMLQISSLPVYTLAAIIGPYRTELKHSNQRGGNLWGMLAWIVGTPPVGVLVLLPYFLWRPGLWLTLPLSLVYSVGLYVLTLKPLASLTQRRAHVILEKVTTDG